MMEGIRVKVCGLTSLVDARLADEAGADYLGFIQVVKSPRYVSAAQFAAMRGQLPERPRVVVMVEPTVEELRAAEALGFAAFQVHFKLEVGGAALAAWSAVVGPERLWLAPKLPPGVELPDAWLAYAKTWMMDTYHESGYGGSGRSGDWAGFAARQAARPDRRWLLAGGLNAENVGAALAMSGAKFIDLNSGVETSPGVKDAGKLAAVTAAIRAARRGRAGGAD